jgi:hypothetical protein
MTVNALDKSKHKYNNSDLIEILVRAFDAEQIWCPESVSETTYKKCRFVHTRYTSTQLWNEVILVWLWTTKGSEFESLWGQVFSLLHVVQTGSEVHPTSYPMGIGGSFPEIKAAGVWSWPFTSS